VTRDLDRISWSTGGCMTRDYRFEGKSTVLYLSPIYKHRPILNIIHSPPLGPLFWHLSWYTHSTILPKHSIHESDVFGLPKWLAPAVLELKGLLTVKSEAKG
jgi:hypothetical protein